ncbi:MAG: radical SAM protein [Myxococcota bacterium]
MTAPPFPDLVPTVEWQVAGHCNYDCSYCIQSRAMRVGQPDDETLGRIVRGFARLPGTWEIKVSGGEPFASRAFLETAVPLLASETPHRISVLTNFSAPLKSLERFAVATGERLRITSASLHLESDDAQAFIDKALDYRAIRARHNPLSSFVVNSVLVPGTLRRLLDVRARVEAAGFRWFPQLMKVKGGVHAYDADERRLVEALTRGSHDPRAVNRAPSYEGLHCEAGAWYFVVDQRGQAWSCRTAKRFAAKSLGNLADGSFALRAEGGACPYPICPCTVPPNRGIVRLGARAGASDPELADAG